MTADETSSIFNPLTVAVIRHKLKAITEEVVETMTRTCFSPILNQNQDFSAVILDGSFATISQAERVPIHMGAMPLSVQLMGKAFAGDIHDGDVLVANDPYWGGSHLPDVTMAIPLFVEGRIAMWVALRAHQDDIGGISAGGYSASAQEIWHEGLRIPPLKLVSRGEVREDVMRLIAENSRKPNDLRGDLMAQLTAVRVGKERLAKLYEHYGQAEMMSSIEAILRGGETTMRSLLGSCRDGEYRGMSYLEFSGAENGLLPIPVRLTIRNGGAEIDLTEAPDQVQAFINSPLANTRAAVLVSLLYFAGDENGLNDGSLRAIDIRTRPGSLLDPVPPAPVGACTSSTACAVIEAMLRALEGADSSRSIGGFARRFRFALAGIDHDGSAFIWHQFFNKGGTGASRGHDGWPNIGGFHNPGGTPALGIERTERSYPLTVEEYSLRIDSGGAGQWRGGLGGKFVARYDGKGTAVLNASGEGVRVVPFGASGGCDGAGHYYAVERSEGGLETIGVHESGIRINPGDRIICLSAGGGGWGDPRLRSRAEIARDLAYGYISEAVARDQYGISEDDAR